MATQPIRLSLISLALSLQPNTLSLNLIMLNEPPYHTFAQMSIAKRNNLVTTNRLISLDANQPVMLSLLLLITPLETARWERWASQHKQKAPLQGGLGHSGLCNRLISRFWTKK